MRRKTNVRLRKEPLQKRSRQMTEDILAAAARVLTREGLIAFNTNRVAEVAGVSVGSLYQYFPNKESILFRLQEREMQETWSALEPIISDTLLTPRERVERVVHAFFDSEVVELALRTALQRAGVYFEMSSEYRDHEAKVVARLCEVLREMLSPTPRDLMFKAHFVLIVVSSVAAHITDEGASSAEVHKWAQACSDMLCHYLGI
jgi:AcrR family transcriptional regulator